MKTILVPVDLSAATFRVCKAACALAKLIHARLVLVNVVHNPPIIVNDLYGYDVGTASAMAEAVTAGEKYAARRLRSLARSCASRSLKVSTLQLTGDPVREILARVKALRADYVVVGTHGHGVAYDLLVGSTTQGILRKVKCPVLVVPIPR